jgi:hypothetical protein
MILGKFGYVSREGGSQNLIQVGLYPLDYSELVCSSYARDFLQHDFRCVSPFFWAEPLLQRDGCHCCMNFSECVDQSIF